MNMADKLERIYTIPLGKAYETIRTKRTARAVKLVQNFVSKNMKTEDVKISTALNTFLWKRSSQKPPRKIKVRVIRENNVVNTYLVDEKVNEKKETKTEAKKEQKKDVKEETKTVKQESAGKKEHDEEIKRQHRAQEMNVQKDHKKEDKTAEMK